MTTSFDEINSLDPIEFIAGTSLDLYFNVEDENGIPVDITTGTPSWVLCPYGRPNVVIASVSGVIEDTSQFSVSLELSDTQNLSGVYLQQAILVDFTGKEFRKQGLVTISPRIA